MKTGLFSLLSCALFLALAVLPLSASAQEPAVEAPKPIVTETRKAQAAEDAAADSKSSKTEAAHTSRAGLSGISLEDLNKPAAKLKFIPEQPSDDLVQYLTMTVLIFGLLVLGLMTLLILKDKSPTMILRLFTVPLVVVAAIFLIVTGYSNDQIAPVIGLFGTLVGYILGANSQHGEPMRGPQEEVPVAQRKSQE